MWRSVIQDASNKCWCRATKPDFFPPSQKPLFRPSTIYSKWVFSLVVSFFSNQQLFVCPLGAGPPDPLIKSSHKTFVGLGGGGAFVLNSNHVPPVCLAGPPMTNAVFFPSPQTDTPAQDTIQPFSREFKCMAIFDTPPSPPPSAVWSNLTPPSLPQVKPMWPKIQAGWGVKRMEIVLFSASWSPKGNLVPCFGPAGSILRFILNFRRRSGCIQFSNGWGIW